MGRTASPSDENGASAGGGSPGKKRIAVIRRNAISSASPSGAVRRGKQGTREAGVASGISARSCSLRLHIERTGRERAAKARTAPDSWQNLDGGDAGGVCGFGDGAPHPPNFARLLSECCTCGS